MASGDHSPPAAKCRKLDTNWTRLKCNFASEVSRRQYADKATADVVFTFVGSTERVSAHKSVLSNASKVFRRLLYDPQTDDDGEVLLDDISIEAFKTVLQF